MEARTGHLSGAFVPAPDEYWGSWPCLTDALGGGNLHYVIMDVRSCGNSPDEPFNYTRKVMGLRFSLIALRDFSVDKV